MLVRMARVDFVRLNFISRPQINLRMVRRQNACQRRSPTARDQYGDFSDNAFPPLDLEPILFSRRCAILIIFVRCRQNAKTAMMRLVQSTGYVKPVNSRNTGVKATNRSEPSET